MLATTEPSTLEPWVDWSTIAVGVVAIITLIITSLQLTARERRHDREQASRVFLVPWNWHWGHHVDEAGGDPVWSGEVIVRVVNRSDAPVYEIAVNLLTWSWEEKRESVTGRVIGALPPRKKSVKIPFKSVPEPPKDYETILLFQPPVEIEFRDANGLRWHRSPNGSLRQIKRRRWWHTRS